MLELQFLPRIRALVAVEQHRMAPDVKKKKEDGDSAVEDSEIMRNGNGAGNGHIEGDEEDEEEEEEDEEPRLKYASLTKSQAPVYRNGDATSSFLVAGDKMVC